MDYKGIINKYINEYIELGKQAGYFNTLQSIKFRKKLESIKLTIDSTLPGNARVLSNTLIINPDIFFINNERFTYEVFFHEFSHLINSIHIDIVKDDDDSLLKSYRNTFLNTMNIYFNKDYSNSELNSNDDINSPYTYVLWGTVLLDEAITQNITEDLLSIKYNTPRVKRDEYCSFANIKYKTDFSIYGIYQELSELFTKTLRGYNTLRDLSIGALDSNFVNNLISEHMENSYTYEALYKKLSYLGVIYFAQEKYNGHLSDRKDISPSLINYSYKKAMKYCEDGIDNRPKPIYKKIIKRFNRLDTI